MSPGLRDIWGSYLILSNGWNIRYSPIHTNFLANRKLEDSPTGCLWHTCNMGVFEHEKEAIAERGAAGLGASKEERQYGHHEVLVMELRVLVGLLLVPHGREKGGSGVPGALQGDTHTY